MILFEESGVLRVSYEAERGLQIHEWFEYNPEDHDDWVFDALENIYELLRKYPVKKLLVKTGKSRGAFSPQVLTFIRDVQFPRLARETQIRFVATVRSSVEWDSVGTLLWEGQMTGKTKVDRKSVV